MHATLIAENYAGMLSQGRGLLERAGFSWDFQPVNFKKNSSFSSLKFRLGADPLKYVNPLTVKAESDFLVSIGGKGAIIGKALGSICKLPVIQIQNPRISLKNFALVIANHHDKLKGENVFAIRTALHGVTDQALSQARHRWSSRLIGGESKILGVLLGGSNGRYVFGEKEAVFIAHQIQAFITAHNMSCIITPSRRTDPKALNRMEKILTPYNVRILKGEGEDNPYLGILACSDCLAVTEDSVSMISEAIATRLPVGILPLSGQSSRLKYFINILKTENRVTSFGVNMKINHTEKLDDTPLAVEEIKRRIFLLRKSLA
ncbi:hypothetical protein GT348_03750 [Aristophania vespae]|uniref:Nucleoside-diphosphate sugar epimerase n=1 Tax=Aristophania vespae TaxID=2697033 RepID=A0A6P1NDA7_9PROT|nr:mitochondrial fission ELM1 family protein [Aristophania vespae]QHI95498.1 hypothetical protein GT348_03750 [Aristophania vespae]